MNKYLSIFAMSFLLFQTGSSYSATTPVQPPTFIAGLAQPIYDLNKSIVEDVYVLNGLDSNFDGLPDVTHIVVVRPKETDAGIKMSTILFPSPYFESGGDNNNAYLKSLYDVNVSSLYDGSPGFNNVSTITLPDNSKSSNNSNLQQAQNNSNRMLQGLRDYFVPRGFVTIFVESLGTGQSVGCPSLEKYDEGLAVSAVVDWLNNRVVAYDVKGNPKTAPWSNGKAGSIGISYGGVLTALAATTNVSGLKVNIPISMVSNGYDYYRSYGLVRACGGCQGEDGIGQYIYDINLSYLNICNFMTQSILAGQDRITGDYNAEWDSRKVLNFAKRGMSPTLVVHGLNDWNVKVSQSINWYNKMKSLGVPVKLALHQGVHQNPAGVFGADMWFNLLNRWMSQFLYDQNNHVLNDPIYIQREDQSIATYPDYPDPKAVSTTFKFIASGNSTDGALGTTPSAASAKIVDDSAKSLSTLITTAGSPNRLLFKSAVLTQPKRLSGTPAVKLSLAIKPFNPNPAAKTVAANVSIALVDLKADGTYKIVTRGWMDPQNYQSISYTTFLKANTFYPLNFTMEPNDYVFAAGSRIAIVIYSSDLEFTLLPPAGTELTFDLNASNVTIPLVQ